MIIPNYFKNLEHLKSSRKIGNKWFYDMSGTMTDIYSLLKTLKCTTEILSPISKYTIYNKGSQMRIIGQGVQMKICLTF